VDKAATYQAYVIKDGKPIAGCSEIGRLLAPIIEERILPFIRAKYRCPEACIESALVRRYRAGERTSLPIHYDIEAFATAIIPLSVQADRAAGPPSHLSTYEGGLFVQGGASRSSRRLIRFGPGDVLVHQFDLMHGVEVHAGTRYALALWFSDSPRSRLKGTTPWVLKAAQAGNADAMFLQASFCAQGRFGAELDEATARRWLERGAAQGHAVSLLGLGRHLLGEGEAEAAVASFRLAAEQGHVEAQYTLAICYTDGIGVESSVDEAAIWFDMAAQEGGEFGEAAALELEELRQIGA